MQFIKEIEETKNALQTAFRSQKINLATYGQLIRKANKARQIWVGGDTVKAEKMLAQVKGKVA